MAKVARIALICANGERHEADVSHIDFGAVGYYVPNVPEALSGRVERVIWMDEQGRALAQGFVAKRREVGTG